MDAYISGLKHIAPELVLIAVALAALVVDLVTKGKESRRVGVLTLGGLVFTGVLLLRQWSTVSAGGGAVEETVLGLMKIDLFGLFFKVPWQLFEHVFEHGVEWVVETVAKNTVFLSLFGRLLDLFGAGQVHRLLALLIPLTDGD